MKQVGGLPRKIRSDDGSENTLVEALHNFLRSSHDDENAGLGCFAIGRSTANQRIEAYLSQLVKDCPGWWINFFKDLSDLGLFNGSDPVHQECIRFCFTQILRDELHQHQASLETAVVLEEGLTVCSFFLIYLIQKTIKSTCCLR